LTDHAAERASRHWANTRRIRDGTRQAQGSTVFASPASVTETHRRRRLSPSTYIGEGMTGRR